VNDVNRSGRLNQVTCTYAWLLLDDDDDDDDDACMLLCC